jgi:hypothetical protein
VQRFCQLLEESLFSFCQLQTAILLLAFFFEKWGVPGLCINRCTQPILLLAKLQQTIIVIHIK